MLASPDNLQAAMSLLVSGLNYTTSTLYRGGTIVAFDRATEGLRVVRDGALVVLDDRIASVSEAVPDDLPAGTVTVDISGKIVTPGFVDTHRHGWQTAFKTIASNASLIEYAFRYSTFAAHPHFTAEDVYNSQLAGLYEAQAAGVTTIIDHAHHTWSADRAEAGLQASMDSGSRVYWCYNVENVTAGFDTAAQLAHLRDLAARAEYAGTATRLGVAYDHFGPDPDLREAAAVWALADEFALPLVTAHSLQGPWGAMNTPEDLHRLGYLAGDRAVVLSHGAFMTPHGANLMRAANQYVSITPESEMHYGHNHPNNYLIQDQAALGVDTHAAFSSDMLTQARLWLQKARHDAYAAGATERGRLPANSPQSAAQALLLATRHGGLALRREDLGVVEAGAQADLVFWDGDSPALLGWADPVAAVVLHASVGDIDTVLIGGRVVKRAGKLTAEGYGEASARFLRTARKIQEVWRQMPLPSASGVLPSFFGGSPIVQVDTADTLRGEGNGYGGTFV